MPTIAFYVANPVDPSRPVEVIQRVEGLAPDGSLPHTIIVAGQHGSETGPVLALMSTDAWALTDGLSVGALTIIRCANPSGFTFRRREDARGKDMNREWGCHPSEINALLWRAIVGRPEALLDTREPSSLTVVDLHSSCIRGNLARTVIFDSDDVPTRAFASELVNLLERHEGVASIASRPWQATITAEAEHMANVTTEHSLMRYAVQQGATAVTVEFPESTYLARPSMMACPVTGEIMQVMQSEHGPWRNLTVPERMTGVLPLVRHLIKRQNGAQA